MTNIFVERVHDETSPFHLPHREMTITLDDVACPLHLPITGRFLDHEKLENSEAIEMLVDRLGVTVEEALREVDKTRGSHVRYSWLKIVFD